MRMKIINFQAVIGHVNQHHYNDCSAVCGKEPVYCESIISGFYNICRPACEAGYRMVQCTCAISEPSENEVQQPQ